MREVCDFYYRKAKGENYAARSVYKLEEIDRKKRIFHKGNQVLDLGCAPGSWSKYISQKVRPQGRVFGVDLSPIKLTAENFFFRQGDVNVPETFTWENFPKTLHAVVSDMAPKTTGIKSADAENSKYLCEVALKCALRYLNPNGVFLVKIFQGESSQDFLKQVRNRFQITDIIKPKAVRSESKEIYIYASKLKTK